MRFCLCQMDVPGPPTHQAIISKPKEFVPDVKPFLVGAKRLPEESKVGSNK